MRVAVLSDIHANLVALDAVIASLGSLDAVWHLGDVVGYGPEPDAVIERLRGIGARGVSGNHDVAALGGDEIDYFNPDARAAMQWTRTRIGPEARTWLAGLPERLEIEGFTLVHGSPREPTWEYVTSGRVAHENLAAFDTPFCLHGHTHVPVVFLEAERSMDVLAPRDGAELVLDERRALVNPGSVGQPRDGDPAASYLVLDTERRVVRWERVPYAIPETQAAMRAAGLPAPLIRRLDFGQ
ncbi:MAG TPA: metallophosphoesterase family protein [Candidatus Limnocylindrales bacterium]